MLRSKYKRWHLLVVLFASLAFVILITTAASHHHKSLIEEAACMVCGAASDKVATDFVSPSVGAFVPLAVYFKLPPVIFNGLPIQPILAPLNRGPPRVFV